MLVNRNARHELNIGLTQEKLTKIIALQTKFDFEIKYLAAECNLEPEFVKVLLLTIAINKNSITIFIGTLYCIYVGNNEGLS